MRVLGLDPGSRRTGFGVVEARGNAYRCLSHGPIVPGARLDMPQRLLAIAARVDEIITQEQPDCVCIEEAFYHESVRSTLVLGHVRGALMLTAVRRGVSIAEYSPREIKMSVAGNGAASKEQVQFMVKRLLALETSPQADAADALAAALCHLHRARRSVPARATSSAANRAGGAAGAREDTMIASLRGTLLERSVAGVVIEAAGVGYAVSVSTHTLSKLPPAGAEVFVRTRQVVREDAHLLFGFLDEDELKLFDLLLSVSGVGPKVALAVLSGLEARALVRAIREESIASLVAVPGIGRKTAERLVVELRDKMDAFAPSVASGATAGAGARAASVLPRNEKFEDAVAALTRLGYTAPQAQDVLRRVAEGHEDLALEALVKRALALLARPTSPVR